ncbi:hypothetical protein USDA257_p03100 (plasmid) [Sinorhizobium fredii USDA 257]|uniref:Uncharacterized protein n=1 Tax=Sinorhizobium fredii (strain USDA 257) TaxID=1185652 RepID=I3XGL9_SINF2|nr:hypothetical protein USDA257_p03100 [Sinorhizobium fredii USDA 257]
MFSAGLMCIGMQKRRVVYHGRWHPTLLNQEAFHAGLRCNRSDPPRVVRLHTSY